MNQANLTRIDSNDICTIGVLEFGENRVYTLEPPWRNNEPCVSCIPVGTYPCIIRKSPKYGWKYWLQNTAPRTYVLIHGGTLVKHTMGCILPGMRRGRLNGQACRAQQQGGRDHVADLFSKRTL